MNKHLILIGIITLSISACGPVYVTQQTPPPPPPPPPAAPAPPPDVTYQTFYDQLSPYGQWVQNPQYGYVWLPDVGPDFKPYGTNGHWVYTEEGWAWDSGYPWGWATFHYGRWFFQDGYGWMWVPGNEWAPAWVQWRNSDDYYGWAPLGPNISINIAFGGGYTPPPHYWCFVPHQYVASPQVNNYYVRETNNVTIINRTTVINNYNVHNTTVNNTTINNTTVNNNVNNVTVNNNIHNNIRYGGGPDPNEVSRFSGAQVRPMAVRETNTPGTQASGSSFAVYRPRVNAATAGDNRPGFSRPAPAQVQSLDNVRPVNRNSYSNNNGNNGNHNGWDNNNGNNGNHNGWDNNNGNNGNHNGWNNQPARTTTGFSNSPANQPVNNQPLNNQPVNNQPANHPNWNQPANNFPANNNPNPYARPGAQPANNPAVNNPPAGRPVFNQPANNPPVFNQPTNNTPVNNQPANNQPARNPGFNRPWNNPAQTQQNQAQQNQARPAGFQQNNNRNVNTIPGARPVANSPKPAPAERNAPPQQKKDDQKKDN